MNNRKDFLRWLGTRKDLSAFERRMKIWKIDGIEKQKGIFSVSSVKELDGIISSDEVALYREFLLAKFPQADDTVTPEVTIAPEEPSAIEAESVQSTEKADSETEISSDSQIEPVHDESDESCVGDLTPENKENYSDQDDVLLDAEYEAEQPIESEYHRKKRIRDSVKEANLHLLATAYNESLGIDSANAQDTEDCSDNREDTILVLDLATGQYSDIANSRFGMKMTSYVKYSSHNKKQRRKDAFYFTANVPTLLTTSTELNQKKKADSIIQSSIGDTIKLEHNLSISDKIICLVPDYLGDFKDSVKSQIKAAGSNVVQIPRSIAAAYAFVEQSKPEDDLVFHCYDYELDKVCKTEIRIQLDADTGEYLFTRMARRIVSGKEPSSEKAYMAYLESYEAKNRITIPKAIKQSLVETRDIIGIFSDHRTIVFANKDSFEEISFDSGIWQSEINEKFSKFVSEQNDNKFTCILSDFASNNHILSHKQLCVGCKKILDRIRSKAPIWNEYLPELSLEVIKDGHFSNLQLIKKDVSQVITSDSMENEIEIPMENGSFTLPVGKEKVYIPLTREEFGNLQRDKLAMFCDEHLCKYTEPLSVTLSVKYRYGDPESYRLIATTEDGLLEIMSEWCDQSDMKTDDVVYPIYNAEEQISINDSDIDYIENYIDGLDNRISSLLDGTERYYQFAIKDNDDYQESNLLDGVRPRDIRQSFYWKPRLFKNVTSIENFKNNEQCKNILLTILNSNIYSTFYNYLIDENNSELADLMGSDKKLRRAVGISINSFMSMLGAYYAASNSKLQQQQENLIYHFMDTSMEYVINASRCITNDTYGVFQCIAEKMEPGCVVKDLRNISSVCWLNPTWIFDLYNSSPKAIHSIIETASDYLINKAGSEVIAEDNKKAKTLKVRDVMEVLLAVCRLREIDETILDPNDSSTRKLVVAIKELDAIVRDNRDKLKAPFKSRVMFDRNEKFEDGLGAVTDPCYLLITQLSASKHLNLIGFVDE